MLEGQIGLAEDMFYVDEDMSGEIRARKSSKFMSHGKIPSQPLL